jgi:hypothetical protein
MGLTLAAYRTVVRSRCARPTCADRSVSKAPMPHYAACATHRGCRSSSRLLPMNASDVASASVSDAGAAQRAAGSRHAVPTSTDMSSTWSRAATARPASPRSSGRRATRTRWSSRSWTPRIRVVAAARSAARCCARRRPGSTGSVDGRVTALPAAADRRLSGALPVASPLCSRVSGPSRIGGP